MGEKIIKIKTHEKTV